MEIVQFLQTFPLSPKMPNLPTIIPLILLSLLKFMLCEEPVQPAFNRNQEVNCTVDAYCEIVLQGKNLSEGNPVVRLRNECDGNLNESDHMTRELEEEGRVLYVSGGSEVSMYRFETRPSLTYEWRISICECIPGENSPCSDYGDFASTVGELSYVWPNYGLFTEGCESGATRCQMIVDLGYHADKAVLRLDVDGICGEHYKPVLDVGNNGQSLPNRSEEDIAENRFTFVDVFSVKISLFMCLCNYDDYDENRCDIQRNFKHAIGKTNIYGPAVIRNYKMSCSAGRLCDLPVLAGNFLADNSDIELYRGGLGTARVEETISKIKITQTECQGDRELLPFEVISPPAIFLEGSLQVDHAASEQGDIYSLEVHYILAETLPLLSGTYNLCYAPRNPTKNFNVQIGILNVTEGPDENRSVIAKSGEAFTVTVTGPGLSETDKIFLYEETETSGPVCQHYGTVGVQDTSIVSHPWEQDTFEEVLQLDEAEEPYFRITWKNFRIVLDSRHPYKSASLPATFYACWCPGNTLCNDLTLYFVAVATIYVSGPDANPLAALSRREYGVGDLLDFTVLGHGFSSDDKLAIIPVTSETLALECGVSEVVEDTLRIYSVGAATVRESSETFTKAIFPTATAQFSLCWCTGEECGQWSGFRTFLGTIWAKGPEWVDLTVCPGSTFALTLQGSQFKGSEKISVVGQEKTCGLTGSKENHSSVHVVDDAHFATFSDASTREFGLYTVEEDFFQPLKLCFCGGISYAGNLETCTEDADFSVWIGNVTISGAAVGHQELPESGGIQDIHLIGRNLRVTDKFRLVNLEEKEVSQWLKCSSPYLRNISVTEQPEIIEGVEIFRGVFVPPGFQWTVCWGSELNDYKWEYIDTLHAAGIVEGITREILVGATSQLLLQAYNLDPVSYTLHMIQVDDVCSDAGAEILLQEVSDLEASTPSLIVFSNIELEEPLNCRICVKPENEPDFLDVGVANPVTTLTYDIENFLSTNKMVRFPCHGKDNLLLLPDGDGFHLREMDESGSLSHPTDGALFSHAKTYNLSDVRACLTVNNTHTYLLSRMGIAKLNTDDLSLMETFFADDSSLGFIFNPVDFVIIAGEFAFVTDTETYSLNVMRLFEGRLVFVQAVNGEDAKQLQAPTGVEAIMWSEERGSLYISDAARHVLCQKDFELKTDASTGDRRIEFPNAGWKQTFGEWNLPLANENGLSRPMELEMLEVSMGSVQVNLLAVSDLSTNRIVLLRCEETEVTYYDVMIVEFADLITGLIFAQDFLLLASITWVEETALKQMTVRTLVSVVKPPAILYIDVPEILYADQEYVFTVSISGGKVDHFYEPPDQESYLADLGLSLDENTGTINGVVASAYHGSKQYNIVAGRYLVSTNVPLTFQATCPLGEMFVDSSCTPCEIGTYNSGESSLEDGCLPCIEGSTTLTVGSWSDGQCLCVSGKGYSASEHACIACESGTFKPEISNAGCVLKCPAGSRSNVEGGTSLDDLNCQCVPGYSRGDDGVCRICATGSYCEGEDIPAKECDTYQTTLGPGKSTIGDCLCVAGTSVESNERADQPKTCIPCSNISYKAEISDDPCTPCSEDTTGSLHTAEEGSKHVSACKLCASGYYYSPVKNDCVICLIGSYCPGGLEPKSDCPRDSTTLTIGSTSALDCGCVEGYGVLSERSELPGITNLACAACEAGYYQSAHVADYPCTPCPANTHSMVLRGATRTLCLPRQGYHFVNYSKDEVQEEVEDVIFDCEAIELWESFGEVAYMTLRATQESCRDSCARDKYCQACTFYNQPDAQSTIRVKNHTKEGDFHLFYKPCVIYLFGVPQLSTQGKPLFDSRIPTGVEVTSCVRKSGIFGFEALDRFAPKRCTTEQYCPAQVPDYRAFPCPDNSDASGPGAAGIEECLCMPGFYRDGDICRECDYGTYKEVKSNGQCLPCRMNFTTVGLATDSVERCGCIPGMYNEEGECLKCVEGAYCPGLFLSEENLIHYPAVKCPPGADMPPGIELPADITECLCRPGYGISIDEFNNRACKRCAPGSYKAGLETTPCYGRCPEFATTNEGAVSATECFCLRGFFANFDIDEQGEIILSCIPCPTGSVCAGGFVGNNQLGDDVDSIQPERHLQPFAASGYYAETMGDEVVGFECSKEEQCYGGRGNLCEPGSMGFVCADCQPGYLKDSLSGMCRRCRPVIAEWIVCVCKGMGLTGIILALVYFNDFASRSRGHIQAIIMRIWLNFVAYMAINGQLENRSLSSFSIYASWYQFAFLRWLHWFPTAVPEFCAQQNVPYNNIWYKNVFLSYLDLPLRLLSITIICTILLGLYMLFSKKRIAAITAVVLLHQNQHGEDVWIQHTIKKILDRRLLGLMRYIYLPGTPLQTRIHNLFRDLVPVYVVTLFICLPKLFISYATPLWCANVHAGHINLGNVLVNLPQQKCDFGDSIFLFFFIASSLLLALYGIFLPLFFVYLTNKKYKNTSTNRKRFGFLTNGYLGSYIWWESLNSIRKFITGILIASHFGTYSEWIRNVVNVLLSTVHLGIHSLFQPNDQRSFNLLNRLEIAGHSVSIVTALLIQGSYLMPLQFLGWVPLVLTYSYHFFILYALIMESGRTVLLRPSLTKLPAPWGWFYKVSKASLKLSTYGRGARLHYSAINNDLLLLTPGSKVSFEAYNSLCRQKQSKYRKVAAFNRRFLVDSITQSMRQLVTTFRLNFIPGDWIDFTVRHAFAYSRWFKTKPHNVGHFPLPKSYSQFTPFKPTIFAESEPPTPVNEMFVDTLNSIDDVLSACRARRDMKRKVSKNGEKKKLNELKSVSKEEEEEERGEELESQEGEEETPMLFLSQQKDQRRKGVDKGSEAKTAAIQQAEEEYLRQMFNDFSYDNDSVSLSEYYIAMMSMGQLSLPRLLRVYDLYASRKGETQNPKMQKMVRENTALRADIRSVNSDLTAKIEAGQGEDVFGFDLLELMYMKDEIEAIRKALAKLDKKIAAEKRRVAASALAAKIVRETGTETQKKNDTKNSVMKDTSRKSSLTTTYRRKINVPKTAIQHYFDSKNRKHF